MRSAIAILMPVLMVTALGACLLTTCAPAADSSHACCHSHRSGTPSAPTTAAHQCIHNLLERGKIVPGVHLAGPPPALGCPSPVRDSDSAPVPERLADSAGLFLKIRVLLI
jgi:hypothetical protein